MKTSDRELLERLQKTTEENLENIRVPESLSRENIVKMLKDNSSDAGSTDNHSNGNNIIVLRRITAVAAVFVVVLLSVIVAGYRGNISIIEKYRSFRGFESENPIKQVSDYNEVGNVVRGIKKDTGEESSSSTGLSDEENETLEKFRALFREKIGFAIDEESAATDVQEVKPKTDYQQADIVKSNGKELFILTTASEKSASGKEVINVVDITNPEEMKKVSQILIGDSSTDSVCREIYLNGKVLVSIESRNEAHGNYTSATYYDISDAASPAKVREHIQEGAYVYSKIVSGKLVLVTNKKVDGVGDDEIVPCYTVNGVPHKLNAESVFVAVNAPDGSYMFVTVTDTDNLSSEVNSLALLGCGKNITAVNGGIYVTRAFSSLENDERKTEIYRFSYEGSEMKLSGSYTLEGSIIGGLCSDEGGSVKMVVSCNETATAVRLSKSMELISSDVIAEACTVTAVSYVGNSAVVACSNGKYLVEFSENGAISSKNTSGSIEAGSCLVQLDNSRIVSFEKETETRIRVFNGTELVDTYVMADGISSLVKDDTRTIVKSANGKYFGLPITYDSENGVSVSSYMIFKLDGSAVSVAGVFIHEPNFVGDAATRAVISGDYIFTISGEKVVAFSLFDVAAISSLRTY